jgi:hypothetical protein
MICELQKITVRGVRRNGDKHSRMARYLAKKFVMSGLLTEGNVKIYELCLVAKELTELHEVGRVGMKLSKREIV